MPRRPLPNCALCGDPLRRGANVTYEWDMLPGRPMVGWHLAEGRGCWERADHGRGIIGSGARDGPDRIAEIEARGPGRVIRTGRWAAASVPVAAPG